VPIDGRSEGTGGIKLRCLKADESAKVTYSGGVEVAPISGRRTAGRTPASNPSSAHQTGW
jgi:hypothetical protein